MAPLGTAKGYSSDEASNQVTVISRAGTSQLLWNLPVGARPSEILVDVGG